MASYSRQLLSGSTNGKAVSVAATATAGTTIHTALAGTTGYDEIYLYVTNIDSSAHQLTIEWGAAGSATAHLVDTLSIPANSAPIPICPGLVLQNGLVVGAFADAANKLLITGFVNRIQ
jgi:hypothetical protein